MSKTNMPRHNHGWIGVDFDGTLAHYNGYKGHTVLGDPIALMVERVKAWRANGIEVRILTARASDPDVMKQPEINAALDAWCLQHIGETLQITCIKDLHMIELWDDRAIQVIPNTGMRADGVEG